MFLDRWFDSDRWPDRMDNRAKAVEALLRDFPLGDIPDDELASNWQIVIDWPNLWLVGQICDWPDAHLI